jgi:hypothetical protein
MTSPGSQDYDRIAQKIYELNGENIYEEEDFNKYFDKYMQKDTENSDNIEDMDKLREKSWNYYNSKSRSIPASARKRLVQVKKEKKLGIRYDKKTGRYRPLTAKEKPFTKKEKVLRKQKKYKFIYVGKQKGRTVYTRKIKTKNGIRYIDKKGRYASVHKTKRTDRKRHKSKP